MRTDHNSLNWLISLQDPAGRLARWRILLFEFDYSIHYRPGRVHQVPDALSRVPTTGSDENRLDDDIPCLVATQRDTELLGFVGETEPWDPWFAIGDDPFWNPLLVSQAEDAHCATLISMGELIEEQNTDQFSREVRSRQSATKGSNFEEDEDGILIRKTASR